jgi:hypothetical protein
VENEYFNYNTESIEHFVPLNKWIQGTPPPATTKTTLRGAGAVLLLSAVEV